MKYNLFIPGLILICVVTVYGLSGNPHEFAVGKCVLCHYDVKNRPMDLSPDVTSGCETCHPGAGKTKSHPTDLYPKLSIPKDMPLIEGKLTCVTCHIVHPAEDEYFAENNYLLRRQVRGVFFCKVCHKLDGKGHIVFENIHIGTYKVTDSSTRIDRTSLGCIECHDSQMEASVNGLGAGTWSHINNAFKHPIGTSYENISSREARNYRPASMINREIKLFDGKIGCGTCHNIYSKENFMLVINNRRSRLCLECHIK
jgi:predicted CXXCH cytochrome family protein